MLQFDVGTKVRIRRDLKAREVYGGVYANTAMEKLAGTIKKITNKGKSIVGNITYQLSDSDCSWTAEMLEPVNNSYNKITIKIDSRNPNKVIASQEINHNRKEEGFGSFKALFFYLRYFLVVYSRPFSGQSCLKICFVNLVRISTMIKPKEIARHVTRRSIPFSCSISRLLMIAPKTVK